MELKTLCVLCALTVSAVDVVSGQDLGAASGFGSFPRHDGTIRVVQLGGNLTLDEFVQNHTTAVVLYALPPGNDSTAQALYSGHQYLLEIVGQVLEKRGVGVGIVDMQAEAELAQAQGVTSSGSIYVYFGSRKSVFYGQRTPEILIPFIRKLRVDPVSVIDGKPAKKAFEKVDLPRVVGYYVQGSQGYLAFVEAAKTFYPHVPFYAVFDPLVAKKMKLKAVGDIRMKKPYDKGNLFFQRTPSAVPVNPACGCGPTGDATQQEIEAFVQANSRPVLKKLSVQDIHSPWISCPNSHLIVTFTNNKSPQGYPVYQLLKRVTRANVINPNFNFVWIDPEQFPMMVDQWNLVFGIDVEQPAIGLVNITDNVSQWFDMSLLDAVAAPAGATAQAGAAGASAGATGACPCAGANTGAGATGAAGAGSTGACPCGGATAQAGAGSTGACPCAGANTGAGAGTCAGAAAGTCTGSCGCAGAGAGAPVLTLDERRLLAVQTWLNDIAAGKIRVDGLPPVVDAVPEPLPAGAGAGAGAVPAASAPEAPPAAAAAAPGDAAAAPVDAAGAEAIAKAAGPAPGADGADEAHGVSEGRQEQQQELRKVDTEKSSTKKKEGGKKEKKRKSKVDDPNDTENLAKKDFKKSASNGASEGAVEEEVPVDTNIPNDTEELAKMEAEREVKQEEKSKKGSKKNNKEAKKSKKGNKKNKEERKKDEKKNEQKSKKKNKKSGKSSQEL